MPGTDLVQPARILDYAPDTTGTAAERHLAKNLPLQGAVSQGMDLTWSNPRHQPNG